MKKLLKLTCICSVALLPATSFAQEPEDRTRQREDDAWYDVSEWFDGNDYNPTDEAIGRWDDEKFTYHQGGNDDSDNDANAVESRDYYGGDYDPGYADYQDSNADNNYESYSRYYDTKQSGVYDGYAEFHDNDNDGVYDKYEYQSLDGDKTSRMRGEQMAKQELKNASGKQQTVSGTIAKADMVNRNGNVHFVATIDTDKGSQTRVDFGTNATGLQLFKGDKVTAMGPVAKVNGKSVLLARKIQIAGETRQIERSGRRYQGTVIGTRKGKYGNSDRTVAKLRTDSGKMLTVDMGPASSARRVADGDKITVSGVPVKVGDRVVLRANSVK